MLFCFTSEFDCGVGHLVFFCFTSGQAQTVGLDTWCSFALKFDNTTCFTSEFDCSQT